MLAIAFEPVKRDPANPTTRLRALEVLRALRRLGVAADLRRDGAPSELLVWSRRDWDLDVSALRRRHRHVVFDFTDNLLAYPHPPHGTRRRLGALAWRWRERDRIRRFLGRFDALVVGSPWLAGEARAVFDGPVRVIEDPQPPVPRPVAAQEPRFDAGWVGMAGNLEYLLEVFGDDPRFSGFTLKVITAPRRKRPYRGTRSNAALAARLPFQTTFVEWRPGRDLAELADCRVGLAPLPPNPVTLAKTANKLLLYGALGLPFLGADIPAYRDAVARLGLGRICRTRDDWHAALSAFARDPALARDYAARAPGLVARHYGPEVIARKYLAVAAELTDTHHALPAAE